MVKTNAVNDGDEFAVGDREATQSGWQFETQWQPDYSDNLPIYFKCIMFLPDGMEIQDEKKNIYPTNS